MAELVLWTDNLSVFFFLYDGVCLNMNFTENSLSLPPASRAHVFISQSNWLDWLSSPSFSYHPNFAAV